MKSIRIHSCDELKGRIVLPASKSISARALIINALSGSPVQPENLSDSDDTRVLLQALKSLPSAGSPLGSGATTQAVSPSRVASEEPAAVIDIGPAGTAMRFLTAYLCVTPGHYVLTGTERMRHRPIGILVDALRQLGADIVCEGEEGFPPLRIAGSNALRGGKLTVRGDVSSQYISALLMIAPTLQQGLTLTLEGHIASRPYIDMTLAMMQEFGAAARWTSPSSIEVPHAQYRQIPYHVESDWSAASYWFEMMALTNDVRAQIELVGLHQESIQGDSIVGEMYRELGVAACHKVESDGTEVLTLSKGNSTTRHFSRDCSDVPDLAQTLTVTCAVLGIPFRLSGLQSLRIKETDRISALKMELHGIANLTSSDSELLWEGPGNTAPSEEAPSRTLSFDSHDDHRMAMSLAPVGLRLGKEILMSNPDVVSKSYPNFWDDLRKVGFRIW